MRWTNRDAREYSGDTLAEDGGTEGWSMGPSRTRGAHVISYSDGRFSVSVSVCIEFDARAVSGDETAGSAAMGGRAPFE